jgi:PilZ domain
MPGSIERRRRRSARDLSPRSAEYTIAGTDGAWRPCYLIDVSLMGIGLDFIEAPPPAAAVGREITIRLLSANGRPTGVVLSGEIRNISAGQESLRVGAEFVRLDTTQRAALELLLQRHFA